MYAYNLMCKYLYTHTECTKTLYNTLGTETWPVGVYLQFIGGDKMGEFESIALPPLAPGQLHDINVDLISPSEPGLYQSQWQICTPNGIISAGTHILQSYICSVRLTVCMDSLQLYNTLY